MPDIFDEIEPSQAEAKRDIFDEVSSEREELRRQMREARAEGIGGKVISGLADLGERAAYTLADALGRADVTGITGNILARQGVQRTPTLLQPEDIGTLGKFVEEGLHLPTTAPVEASQGVVPDILKGAKEFATEMGVGLSDPGMIALGGAATKAPREIGRLFQLQMAGALPQSLQDVAAAETLPEAVKSGLGVAANVAFPALIERGLQPKLKPVPDIPGRTLPMREGAKPPTAERQAQLAVEEQLPPEEALTAPPTTKLTPEAERALAEAEAKPTSVRDIALEEQAKAGWKKQWPFVPADFYNKTFREALESDPALSAAEKDQMFSAAEKLLGSKIERATPPPEPPAPKPAEGGGEPVSGKTLEAESLDNVARNVKDMQGYVSFAEILQNEFGKGSDGQKYWLSQTPFFKESKLGERFLIDPYGEIEASGKPTPPPVSPGKVAEVKPTEGVVVGEVKPRSDFEIAYQSILEKQGKEAADRYAEGMKRVGEWRPSANLGIEPPKPPTPSPPAVSPGEGRAKQPWEMTKAEYDNSTGLEIPAWRQSDGTVLVAGHHEPFAKSKEYFDEHGFFLSRNIPEFAWDLDMKRAGEHSRANELFLPETEGLFVSMREVDAAGGDVYIAARNKINKRLNPPPPQPSAGAGKGAGGIDLESAKQKFSEASQKLAKARLTYIIGEPREKFANAPASKRKIMQQYWDAKDRLDALRDTAISVKSVKVPVELPDLRKVDVRSDPRLEMPGITKRSKPNSLIVALRDLESVPVKEIVLKSTGDPIADAKKVEATIRKYAGQQNNISFRESLAVTTGPNGRAILKFGMSPNGMTWASAKEWVDLVESRQQPTPAAQTVGETKPGQVEPGPGAMTVGEPPKPQIEQLTDAFKGIEATNPTMGERVQEAFRLGERLETAKDAFSKALSGLRSTGDYLIGKWRGVEKIDDLLRAKGQLSAQIESRGWRTRAFLKQARKAIPRQRDQAAIAKWIDAGGDRAELERGMRETLPKYRQAYQDALNLRGDLLVAAQNAQNYFESRLAEAIDAGVLKAGVEDYIHRIYESRPNLRDKALAYVQTGILKPNPALARKRVFQFDWEAEKLGYKPVQSFITRLATYESSLAKAIASREFIRKATAMRAEDGRPIIDIKGEGIPIEDPVTGEREATLIKPAFNPSKNAEQYLPDGTLNPNYRGDYVNKEFPALSRWKWVSQDAAGKPIFVQGDVAIHPDYANRVTALLEPSRLRYGKYGHIFRPALKASAAFKQTMLDLSGFHQVQITAHGLEHKVLPWRIIKDIDFADPNVDALLKGGVTLGGDTPAFAAEGLVGASLTRQVPFLGPLMESYHQWLFQSYIPRIKMTMALHALERNRKRYAGQMSEEQIAFKTAQQANSAFGELNYIMLERSKTAQDIARMIFLAPDFLEARSRFAAEAFTKGGRSKVPGFGNEQRAALLLGALTLYITARVANKMLNDQYHFEPENAFSIVHNGRAFSLRTVQGDLLHLMERPVQFWMNRLNPVFGRTMLEIGTGRDYFGRRVNPLEALWDNAKNIVPISLRHGRERKLWESMMNSFGFTARRWNDVDDAFTLARKWKDEHGIGEKGEFIYDPNKDPLRGLKLALNYGTEDAAAAEIKKLMESGYNRGKLVQYFKRYGTMPFTGSFANDKKWIETLSEDERKTVESARAHKLRIRDKYFQSQTMYDAAAAAKPNP